MKLIADNLRITKPEIQAALKQLNPEPVQKLARQCHEENPWAIDVNTGPLTRNPEEGMHFFIQAVEAVTTLPIVIDTSNPKAMRTALETSTNPTLINGFSLEPDKVERILPLAKEFDTRIVGFLLYPDSRVPQDTAQRLEVALELFDKAEVAGVPKERVIIDPVVPPLAWDDGIIQARSVIEVIQTLPDMMGFPVQTIAGVSNLSTGSAAPSKKQLINNSYMAMLASAGLDFALLDIFSSSLVQAARTASILKSETLFSWEMVPDQQ